MINFITDVIQRIITHLRIICILMGLVLPVTVLRAQYSELNNVGSDPNHRAGSLPTFFAKDSVKGSPYLANSWLRGAVDLANHKRLPEPGHVLFFNYDKFNERLFATDGVNRTWIYPNDSISSFSLIDSNTLYLFEKITWISMSHFLQPMVKSESGYSLYKRLITKFISADFKNEGYYTTGNDFDRYTDFYEYYVVYSGNRSFKKLYLNERAIRKSLKSESFRLNLFFSKNSAPLDDHKFVELIQFLNEQGGFSKSTNFKKSRVPISPKIGNL
jgi:hypothetical protein